VAGRLRKTHQEDVRRKIQASQLINLLQSNALGKLERELSESRRKSAEFLLSKSIGNPPTVIEGNPDAPFVIKHEMT